MTPMSATEEKFWPRVLAELEESIPPAQFKTWFGQVGAVIEEDSALEIAVPNRFFREWMQAHYTQGIRDAAQRLSGRDVAVRFRVDPSVARPADSEDPPVSLGDSLSPGVPGNAAGPLAASALNDLYTFDNFVVGPSNRLAHAAAVSISRSPAQMYNPFFLYGSVGLGKSHLLQAVCHEANGVEGRHRALYLSCETFVNQLISAIRQERISEFRERCRTVDILIIDDVQFLGRAERSQEEFFHTFNTLYNSEKQIVLSSDMAPDGFRGLQPRLLSRFKSGLVARIDAPCLETREAIVQKKAAVRGVNLDRETVKFIAGRIPQNIREIEGMIVRIIGYGSLTGQPVTLDLARSVVEETSGPRTELSIDDILRAVCKHFGLRVSELLSKKRSRSVAFPRQICMHLSRSLTDHSLEEIGGYFGGRDHTTVLYADTKIREQASEDPLLRRALHEITGKLEKGRS